MVSRQISTKPAPFKKQVFNTKRLFKQSHLRNFTISPQKGQQHTFIK